MHKFTGNDGHEWGISLNSWTAREVKKATGVDLLDLETLTAKLADAYVLVDVLWVMVRKEAEAAGIADEEFGRSLAGDAIEAATAAMLEEIIDFFPQPRRPVLRKALEKANLLTEEMTRAATEAMDRLTLGDLSSLVAASSD